MTMTSKRGHQAGRSEGSAPSYPKRYWWLVLVVVPIVGALIQYQPWKRASGQSAASTSVSGNQFLGSAFIGNVSLVVNEAQKAGAALDPALVENLKEAVESSKSRNHDAAIAKIEAVRAGSSTVRDLPSLVNNLGVEYISAGRLDQARTTFEEVLAKDPGNKTAWAGLGQLPDHPIAPLKVVNYSSRYGAGPLGYYRAEDVVDGAPNSYWLSAPDATLPHSFVIELPVHAVISEVSFNNPTFKDGKYAAKEIALSFSQQSATSGFENVVKATLTQGEIGQGVSVKPTSNARWLKLRILTNYGDPSMTSLGDISVVGRPNPQ